MNQTYITAEVLSERIQYTPRTIRDHLKDSVLLEGTHYIRPFGGRKILYIWEAIERDMVGGATDDAPIPMSSGRVCRAG